MSESKKPQKHIARFSRWGTLRTNDRAPKQGLPSRFKGAAKRGSAQGRKHGVSLPTVSVKDGDDYV